MASFRPQISYPDELIQSLARKFGINELTNFTNAKVEALTDKAEISTLKAKVKDLLFDALNLVVGGASAPIPANAYIPDAERKLPYFADLSRRTIANEIKGERRAPAEVLAERFRTKIGEPVWLTEAELVEESVRIYHENGRQAKTVNDVISESISQRCQSQISNFLQVEYGSSRTARKRDYSNLELAITILRASLNGSTEIVYAENGISQTYQVPLWGRDDKGNGYGNTYKLITPSYIIKACSMYPVNHPTNLQKVKTWLEEANVTDVTIKVKGIK
jgi:hypothetical protein